MNYIAAILLIAIGMASGVALEKTAASIRHGQAEAFYQAFGN